MIVKNRKNCVNNYVCKKSLYFCMIINALIYITNHFSVKKFYWKFYDFFQKIR